MKSLQNAIWMFGVAVCAATSVVRATQGSSAGGGDPFEMWFDENGHAVASVNGGALIPVVSGVEVEPISGMNALFYELPLPVDGTGDVRVWEDSAHTALSDLLRFTTTKMYFFSDNSDAGDTNLADTGLPAQIFPLDLGGINEVGPEGENHFDWFPVGNIYHGVSDGTLNLPDVGPGFGLSTVAMLLPLFFRRFRR